MPLDTFAASSEIVPVGAIDVRQPLRIPFAAIASRTSASSRAILGRAKKALGIVERKCALLGGKSGAGAIGGILDDRHPARSLFTRRRAAIGSPEKNQRVGKAGDAETNAPFGAGFARLCVKRIARNVDDVVEEPDGRRNARLEFDRVDPCFGRERLLDELREVDRSQKARAVGRQRLLSARVRRRDRLAIGRGCWPR